MGSVARALGIRTPSLYHHFPGGRDEMVLAIADTCARIDGDAIRAILASSADVVVRLNAVARHFAGATTHHPYHMLTEQRKKLGPEARQELQRLFAAHVEAPLIELVEEGQELGVFRRLAPELVVRAFLTLMLSLREFEADDPQRRELPDFLVSLLIEGLERRDRNEPGAA